MSRIGNKPITVPNGVEVTIQDKVITVKGPKGTLTRQIHKNMEVQLDGTVLTVKRLNEEAANKALHGLTRSLLNNMVVGVTEEFKRELEINGVGYRAAKAGTALNLSLGYSHPVKIEAPQGITFDVPNPNQIIVRGIDKELVGQMAAEIRSKREPEPYRGKGIKYVEEHIRRKEGKTGK